MKLLSINLARSIWLVSTLDLNPRGIRLDRILYPFLIDTYKFRKYPSSLESVDPNKGEIFEDGEFLIENDHSIAVNLTIHNYGIVVDTRSSTHNSDNFLEDVFSRFSEIFKPPTFQSIVKEKLYFSQVYVSTDKSIELLNPKLKQISKYLSQNVGKDKNFQTGGISFWPDQTAKVNPGAFSFERVVGVPFSEHRYYSAAPLPTDKHLELLDKLEKILS